MHFEVATQGNRDGRGERGATALRIAHACEVALDLDRIETSTIHGPMPLGVVAAVLCGGWKYNVQGVLQRMPGYEDACMPFFKKSVFGEQHTKKKQDGLRNRYLDRTNDARHASLPC